MVESPKFDVFLAHNSVDKPQVKAIAEELKKRGLKPWLDDDQIPPGCSFQEEIEKAIPLVKSAAIFIGLEGLGRWQVFELRSLTSRCVNEKIPVIPFLLPGIDRIPDNFRFLQEFRWISCKSIDDAAALDHLVWGITKVKPKPEQRSSTSETPSEATASLFQVFEFDVVTVEVQRAGLFSLNSKVMFNRSRSQARYFTEDLGNGVTLDMVSIPSGKFLMGTEDEEIERLCTKYNSERFRREKPQHEVTVQSFFMGKYPVTQAQWKAIASLPKVNRDLNPEPSHFKGDNLPVERVFWYDAVEFCQRLSRLTGKEYRLPSEAEWEYACRAGTTTPFHFGETITTNLANYNGNYTYASEPKGQYLEQTTPVGSFPPNAFGLYDMHGNVWEWCEDDWHDSYNGAPTDGSAWLSGTSNMKVVHGGSWDYNPGLCRSAYRDPDTRVLRISPFGFRVVCVAPRTTR